MPVNLLANSNERCGFYEKFPTVLVFSRTVFTLLQKKGPSYSLKEKNCKIIPKIRFLEKIKPVKLQKNPKKFQKGYIYKNSYILCEIL